MREGGPRLLGLQVDFIALVQKDPGSIEAIATFFDLSELCLGLLEIAVKSIVAIQEIQDRTTPQTGD